MSILNISIKINKSDISKRNLFWIYQTLKKWRNKQDSKQVKHNYNVKETFS